MDPRLLDYYNTELNYLREAGAEFAAQHPKVAARLDLRGLEVADPYVERLLEGMAFLSARVQLKMDAEFPRFAQRLLEVVYPNYLGPTPSICIVQFSPGDMPGGVGDSYRIPRGYTLRTTPFGESLSPCEFRTAHDVDLMAMELVSARLEGASATLAGPASLQARPARSALRLRFELAAPLGGGAQPPERLPLYLSASPHIASRLYELLCGHCVGLRLRAEGKTLGDWRGLPAQRLQGIGFEDEQALLPYSAQGFQGYRLLHEYFACPARFNFVEFSGLREPLGACEGLKAFELVALLDADVPELEPLVDAGSFSLFCTPAVNLIEKRADRLQVDDSRFELHLVADRVHPLDYEVHSVQRVEGFGRDNRVEAEFRPFYRSLAGDRGSHGAYFSVRREPRRSSDSARRHGTRSTYIGSEVFLSLVDQNEAPYASRLRQLGADMWVTNRDLPLLIGTGGKRDFDTLEALPVSAIRILHGPTRPVSAISEGSLNWRLISHLVLGYQGLSAATASEGAERVRELLSLYGPLGDPAVAGQARALIGAELSAITRRLPGSGPLTYGRGVGIELRVDESQMAGTSPFLFGAVLERFLARHVGLNSFTETTLVSAQRGEVGRWQPRHGSRPVA